MFWIVFVLACFEGAPVQVAVQENCSDRSDNDGNGLVDCDDPACSEDPSCLGDLGDTADTADTAPSSETDCEDGLDNDGDGLTDCEDDDCPWTCQESKCNDGLDDDLDGLIDCEDPDCDGKWACVERDCEDGADNDGDLLVDCEDDDCPACSETSCNDGVDNDGDGHTDCKDDDCEGKWACIERDCSDGLDNDADWFVDCQDSDCESNSDCMELDCSDGVDNDGDGWTDCDDSDCPSCSELDCTDGIDDDADGLVDCEDGDCATHSTCYEDCTDGLDNDGDGYTDCEDSECWADCHQAGMQIESFTGNARWQQMSFSSGSSSAPVAFDFDLQMYSPAGQARFATTSGGSVACSWNAVGGRFMSHWGHSYVSVSWSGLTSSGGCGGRVTSSAMTCIGCSTNWDEMPLRTTRSGVKLNLLNSAGTRFSDVWMDLNRSVHTTTGVYYSVTATPGSVYWMPPP